MIQPMYNVADKRVIQVESTAKGMEAITHEKGHDSKKHKFSDLNPRKIKPKDFGGETKT